MHSNVDPLSHLPRAPPAHISHLETKEPSIRAKETLDECQEVKPAKKMAALTFAAWSIEDCLDEPREVLINIRSRNKTPSNMEKIMLPDAGDVHENKEESDQLHTLSMTSGYWGAVNPPPTMSLAMNEDMKQQWRLSYLEDNMFRGITKNDSSHHNKLGPGRRFFVDQDGMIFFNNEDYQPHLWYHPARGISF